MRDSVFFSVLMGDSRGYDAWGRTIAAGQWVGTEVFYQAPLYPYFLGLVYAVLGHDLLAVRLIQAVLGAAACVALGDAVSRLVSPRAGLIAGLMLACYPPAIFFDGLIQKSVFDLLFVTLSLAVIARVVTNRRRRHWLLLGLCMGALALTRENALALIAVVALWAAVRRPVCTEPPAPGGARRVVREQRFPSSSRWLPVLMFAGGVAVALAPAIVHNAVVGAGWYLTTSQFGSNLYIGNNPQADGSYMSLRPGRGSPEFERLDATELAEEASGRRLTPAEVSRYWTGRTLGYVTEQPGDWLALLARKARLLISSTEIIDTESQESHESYSMVLRLLGAVWHFGVLLPLAIVGMGWLWQDHGRLGVVFALTAAYAASVVLFYVVARYRLPVVPLLIVFAAAGVDGLLARWRQRRQGEPAMPGSRRVVLAIALIGAIVSNWPLHTAASQRAITENNLGTALQQEGRIDEAMGRYRRALELDASYTPALNNLGTALRAAGRSQEAVAVYDAALAQGDNRSTVYLNRGNALMMQGRRLEAIDSFRQALAVDPGATPARTALANALYDHGTSALAAGAPPAAATAFREAIALRPEYAEAHNNLGIALAMQGRLNEAIAQWETALRIEPDFADAQRNLQIARTGRF